MKKIKAIKVLGGDIFEQNMLDLINPITSKPFSTIVIAGENGTGKTIFLNRLGYQETNSQKSVESFILEWDKNDPIPQNLPFNQRLMLLDLKDEENEININRNQNPTSAKAILSEVFTKTKENYYAIGVKNKDEEKKLNSEEIYNEATKHLNNFKSAFDYFFYDSNLVMDDNFDKSRGILFRQNGKFFGINNLSDGQKSIISGASKILWTGSFFLPVCLDEPDQKLHFLWQKKLLSFYRKLLTKDEEQTQLFLTTHSEHIVRESLNAEDTLLLMFKRNEKSKLTQIFSYSKSVSQRQLDESDILKKPTYSYIIFSLLNIATNELFDELYCAIEDKIRSSSKKRINHNKFQEFIDNNIDLISSKNEFEYFSLEDDENPWKVEYKINEKKVCKQKISELIVYRQQIHHPNNFGENTKNKLLLSVDKLHSYIEDLISLLRKGVTQ